MSARFAFRTRSLRALPSKADVLQSLQLAGQLGNYGLGYWCLTTQVARKAAGEPEVRPGTHLTDGEELAVAFLAFFFVVGPLAPLAVEVRNHLLGGLPLRKRHPQCLLRSIGLC